MLVIQIVLDRLSSPHSKRAYQRHLKVLRSGIMRVGERRITKAVVQRCAAEFRAQGVAASTVNQKLFAIRKLAPEAADNGALGNQIANGIKAFKWIRQEGTRSGNWLTKQDAQSCSMRRTLEPSRDCEIVRS